MPESASARNAVIVGSPKTCCQKHMTVQDLASLPVLCTIIEIWRADGTQPSMATTSVPAALSPSVEASPPKCSSPRVAKGRPTSFAAQTPPTAVQSLVDGTGHRAAPRVISNIACAALAMFAAASRKQDSGPPKNSARKGGGPRATMNPATAAIVLLFNSATLSIAPGEALRRSFDAAPAAPAAGASWPSISRSTMPTVQSSNLHTVP
mmetsp:Transcript_44818/g.143555  ORF Transcript_44818/g.143555 Transcript_44818/m.143555 type:complete len:208 (+) Transcript_44818:177-800(+)